MPETVAVDTSGSLGSALSGIAGTMAREIPGALAEDKANRAIVRDTARATVGAIDQGTREREAMKPPPTPPPNPPPQYQETSMGDKWGSLAMGMAVLGSAFTRRPATNSLNAAAGVLNAYHDSDAAAYKRNFDNWKAQTDYSLKMYEYQREAYKDAISTIKENSNDAMAKLRVVASAFGDDALKHLTSIGNVAGAVAKIDEFNARLPLLRTETAIAERRLGLVNDFNAARDALKANPTDPAARQRMQAVIDESKTLKTIETGAGSVSDQQYQHQQDLEKGLQDEWTAANPGKEMTASVKADLAAKAKGAVAGKTETAAGGRERALNAAVEADVEKFKADNPDALASDIDKARYESRLKHEGEMGRAVRQPRSASAISVDQFIQDYMKEHDGQRPSSADIQAFMSRGVGLSQRARTVEARAGSLEIAANVADALIPLVKATSDKISRTQYPNVNAVILAAEKGTGDPDVVRFSEMINSLRYAYARALSPTGQARVEDLKRLDGILDQNWAPGQINAALDQIHQTIGVEKEAIEKTRRELLGSASASPGAGVPPAAPTAPAPTAPAAASTTGTEPPKIDSQAAYDALPPGAKFIGPDSKIRTKP